MSYSYDRREASGKLVLGPGRIDQSATKSLSTMPLKSRNNGSLQSAVVSAGFHAKAQKETAYVYSGNSFGHAIWRVSLKPSEYLDPINNTGDKLLTVTPDLIVSWHDIQRKLP